MSEGQDTEITLGTGRLLGIFFGLVVVCALFFGLGFSMGRNSVKSTLTMEEQPTTSLPAQANGGQKLPSGTPERPTTPAETPALENTNTAAQNDASPPVVTSQAPELSRPAPVIPSGAYTVQIAAVSKQEDAEALVSALRKKSYPVFIASNNTDKLFHVQIGPFTDMKEAESMKTKLTGDGYNPIVKR